MHAGKLVTGTAQSGAVKSVVTSFAEEVSVHWVANSSRDEYSMSWQDWGSVPACMHVGMRARKQL